MPLGSQKKRAAPAWEEPACPAVVPAEGARLTDLPDDLLTFVLRLAGQEARLACAAACRTLRRACRRREAWDAMTVARADQDASRFQDLVRCPALTIVDGPHDAEWLLSFTAAFGMRDVLRSLCLRFGSVRSVPDGMLDAVAHHRRLEEFDMHVEECRSTCELAWPRRSSMPRLRRLAIRDDAGTVTVWFGGTVVPFPALERLELEVGCSDVLAWAPPPSLRHLTYLHDGESETFDDAALAGLDLDELIVAVPDDEDVSLDLQDRLATCASVRRLELRGDCDMYVRRLPPGLRELHLCMLEFGEAVVDVRALLDATSLTAVTITFPETDPPAAADALPAHGVYFDHCSFADLLALTSRARVALPPTAAFQMDPQGYL